MRAVFVALTLAMICGGCAGIRDSDPGLRTAASDPDIVRGQQIAERRCAGCHAIGLDDAPATSGPRFRDLRNRYNALSLQRRFEAISQHGAGEMPPVQIGSSDAEGLIAYLESLGDR